MQIKLSSNRKWIIKTFLPFLIIGLVLLLIIMIGIIVEHQSGEEMFENEGEKIISLVCGLLLVFSMLAIVLIAKYKKRKSFIFDEKQIQIFDKFNNLQKTINVSDVEGMLYLPMGFTAILLTLGGGNYSGANKILIEEKGGDKTVIGFIDFKDAERLKELYPDLLNILHKKYQNKNNDTKEINKSFDSSGDSNWNEFVDWCCTGDLEDKDFQSEKEKFAYYLFWYQSEVNNGGASQYFSNKVDWPHDEITALFKKFMPFSDLHKNYKYGSKMVNGHKLIDEWHEKNQSKEMPDEQTAWMDEIEEKTDAFFYENEQEIMQALESVAVEFWLEREGYIKKGSI